MTVGTIDIKTPRDLAQALAEAKKIEEAFEGVLNWQGFLTVSDGKTGELLRRLVRDSEIHERLVESLIRRFGPSKSAPGEKRSTSIVIDGSSEMLFLEKLLEAEDTAYYVYSAILEGVARLDANSIGGPKNAAEFRQVLGRLVSAERGHRELVSRLIADRGRH